MLKGFGGSVKRPARAVYKAGEEGWQGWMQGDRRISNVVKTHGRASLQLYYVQQCKCYFFFIAFPQQMIGWASAQPHKLSTVTPKPHTPQTSLDAFFATGFFPDFFAGFFLAADFFTGMVRLLLWKRNGYTDQ
jgi:hypothetical protein